MLLNSGGESFAWKFPYKLYIMRKIMGAHGQLEEGRHGLWMGTESWVNQKKSSPNRAGDFG
jgi:hypothetical protein